MITAVPSVPVERSAERNTAVERLVAEAYEELLSEHTSSVGVEFGWCEATECQRAGIPHSLLHVAEELVRLQRDGVEVPRHLIDVGDTVRSSHGYTILVTDVAHYGVHGETVELRGWMHGRASVDPRHRTVERYDREASIRLVHRP